MTHTSAVVLHASNHANDLERAILAVLALRKAHPDIQAEIIVHGEALDATTPQAEPLSDLIAEAQVEIKACRIGLSRRGIAETDLQTGIGITPNAMVALFEAQQHGAAYIRL